VSPRSGRYLPAAAAEDSGRRGTVFRVNTNDRLIGSTLALAGFAIAMLAGLFAGNDAITVLSRAIIAMVACRLVGSLISMIYGHVATDHLSRYRAAHPIPGKFGQSSDAFESGRNAAGPSSMEVARAA
jgi:hypothetical protein